MIIEDIAILVGERYEFFFISIVLSLSTDEKLLNERIRNLWVEKLDKTSCGMFMEYFGVDNIVVDVGIVVVVVGC